MKFSLIKMDEIDEALCRRWQDIRLTSSIYGSPYYHPEYAKIAARAKQNAWLLICEDGGQVSGLLPFHLRGSFRAEVIGGVLSDYQGPINLPNFEWPIREMLRAMKVCHFGFNHMPTERKEFERFSWSHSRSQIINLTGGFESYSKNLLETRDASLLKKINTSLRKLSNKYGEVQFAMQSLSDVDFQTLKKGKSEQFIRTAGYSSDIFSVPWISQMLDEIRFSSFPDFCGMLSTLTVDGMLVAAHFGMRSDCVLHYWFPWYCHDFSDFSPGLILLAQCAKEAQQNGIDSIDLGRGEQAYKLRFANDTVSLCEGAVSSPSILTRSEARYFSIKKQFRNSYLGNVLRSVRRKIA